MTEKPKNKAYIYPHLGYGDIINMIGAIRYYATKYDEVIVACKPEKLANCRLFFRDDPKIILEAPFSKNVAQIKRDRGVNQVFLCGLHNPNRTPINGTNVPDCFYVDIKLNPEIRKKYFHFVETENSEIMYQKILELGKKFIFVHDRSSQLKLDLMGIKIAHPNHLVINCDYNMYYKSNPYHELVQQFVGHPIIDYSKIIKNAEAVHVIDSCMFCLANNLDLSKVKKKVVYIRTGRRYPTYLQGGFIVRTEGRFSNIDKL